MSPTVPPPSLSVDQIDWLMVTANCLVTQQYPERAAILLEFLLCCEPENPRAQQMLGYCYYLSGRNEEALARFRTLDQPSDNPINALLQAKAMAALGRADEAAHALGKISENPENTS